MKIATWNVNSINVRLPRVLSWLQRTRPDIVCLQELKAPNEAFPFQEFEALGYKAVVHGQRTYNGVAILSLMQPEDPLFGMGDQGDESQARIVAATCAGIRVVCIYVPNGGEIGTPTYEYKLEWLNRFRAYVIRAGAPRVPMAVCGDFNIVPTELDCHDPNAWEGTVLYNADLRAWFKNFLETGFEDTFRLHHPNARKYSWWDYRGGAFPKNEGLRIDFILTTPPLAERCIAAGIERDERKGQKPSDHVPVWAEFS